MGVLPDGTQRMTDFSPREIVSELDRYIVGQGDAKRAVAIALRNRWRRLQLDDKLREEVLPKNILMIGPTGVGKTEISASPSLPERRFSKSRQPSLRKSGTSDAMSNRLSVTWSKSASRSSAKKRKDVTGARRTVRRRTRTERSVGPGASPATRETSEKLRDGN